MRQEESLLTVPLQRGLRLGEPLRIKQHEPLIKSAGEHLTSRPSIICAIHLHLVETLLTITRFMMHISMLVEQAKLCRNCVIHIIINNFSTITRKGSIRISLNSRRGCTVLPLPSAAQPARRWILTLDWQLLSSDMARTLNHVSRYTQAGPEVIF